MYAASAFANHLWQSTAVAGIAAVLALALRKNQARPRYWLWLAASLKFLLPFSVLVALAGEWRLPAPVAHRPVPAAVVQLSEPFHEPVISEAPTPARDLTPAVLLSVWSCGFLAVVFLWSRGWRKVRGIVRMAAPVAWDVGVPVLLSPAPIEPGVFGILRPVLVLPRGITEHLDPVHVRAVIAHELCHVRRRDNLWAAVHMLVEAIFWFHPLVWWIGARMMEERERACDEEVLRRGSSPEIYAESILRTCRFFVESPVECAAGVTGSDLKKRIARIMAARAGSELGFVRALLLAGVAVAAIALPVFFGVLSRAQSHSEPEEPRLAFEVASIKRHPPGDDSSSMRSTPGRFTSINQPVILIVSSAYGVDQRYISGGPAWMRSDPYDFDCRMDDGEVETRQKLDGKQRQKGLASMLRTMLAERFQLRVRHETKTLPVYALVVGKGGVKFHDSAPEDGAAHPSVMVSGNELTLTNASMAMLAMNLPVERFVIDQTGLTGKYDLKLHWSRDEGDGADAPNIFTAVQEQLGLKLESTKGPVDTLVIEHIERPSAN